MVLLNRSCKRSYASKKSTSLHSTARLKILETVGDLRKKRCNDWLILAAFIRPDFTETSIGTLKYIRYDSDFPFFQIDNTWNQQSSEQNKSYVVQTSDKIIQRSTLMTTDPGDLVLDITCGSGTTAFVAENWGRRWITCDTSRVATALAKQRLMTADFDYFELAHPDEGVGSGFRYKTVPHITSKKHRQQRTRSTGNALRPAVYR